MAKIINHRRHKDMRLYLMAAICLSLIGIASAGSFSGSTTFSGSGSGSAIQESTTIIVSVGGESFGYSDIQTDKVSLQNDITNLKIDTLLEDGEISVMSVADENVETQNIGDPTNLPSTWVYGPGGQIISGMLPRNPINYQVYDSTGWANWGTTKEKIKAATQSGVDKWEAVIPATKTVCNPVGYGRGAVNNYYDGLSTISIMTLPVGVQAKNTERLGQIYFKGGVRLYDIPESDIALNSRNGWRFQGWTRSADGRFEADDTNRDPYGVLLHELGHTYGLTDRTSTASTMGNYAPSLAYGGTFRNYVDADSAALAKAIQNM